MRYYLDEEKKDSLISIRELLLMNGSRLEYFDTDSCRFEPLANPFGPKVLPMS